VARGPAIAAALLFGGGDHATRLRLAGSVVTDGMHASAYGGGDTAEAAYASSLFASVGSNPYISANSTTVLPLDLNAFCRASRRARFCATIDRASSSSACRWSSGEVKRSR